jgi:FtsZ-binding cell division protein ZapB
MPTYEMDPEEDARRVALIFKLGEELAREDKERAQREAEERERKEAIEAGETLRADTVKWQDHIADLGGA